MLYFILHNDIQEGPYPPQEVKRLLREGRYAPENLCWREGWSEWRPLSSVLGMVPKSGESYDRTSSTEGASEVPTAEILESTPIWQPEGTGKVEKRVVVLVVIVLLLGALCVVLALLLMDSQTHNQRQAAPVASRAELEQALLEAGRTLRGPQAPNEIRTWVTYNDVSTSRPLAVARANVLLYPESMVADVLLAPATKGVSEMMDRLQSTLPPPWRETITDSNGVATISPLQTGTYYVIVFAQKAGSTEPESYFWVAKRQVDDHPSQSLILSEKNATTVKSVDLKIIE